MVNNLVYIADYSNNVVRVVNRSSNIITKFAGNYTYGNYGDGGQATNALLGSPADIAADPVRNLVYIVDCTNNNIRVVNTSTGIITKFAGGGNSNGLSKSLFVKILFYRWCTYYCVNDTTLWCSGGYNT
jgi:DNA-binding beta-propeller fold protein YncE